VLSLKPSLVAVMVVLPMSNAVTAPFRSTSATKGLELVQTIVRPRINLFWASFSVTTGLRMLPTCVVALSGATPTKPTGMSTNP
jgi:hypothetical protein